MDNSKTSKLIYSGPNEIIVVTAREVHPSLRNNYIYLTFTAVPPFCGFSFLSVSPLPDAGAAVNRHRPIK